MSKKNRGMCKVTGFSRGTTHVQRDGRVGSSDGYFPNSSPDG